MSTVVTLAKKDIKVLLRDKFALFWILAFPLGYALFFGMVFGGGGDDGGSALPVAVVDEDDSDYSRAVVERFVDSDATRVTRDANGERTRPTLEEARTAVQKGTLVAYLHLPAGFGDNPYAIFGARDADAPTLELGIDPGRQAEAGMLQGIVMETVYGALMDRVSDTPAVLDDLAEAQRALAESNGDMAPAQKFLLDTFLGGLRVFLQGFDMAQVGLGASAADGDGDASGSADVASPAPGGAALRLVDVTRKRDGEPRSAFDITMPQGAVWGLLSVALGFAITLVRERSSGTLVRLRMAPVSHAQLLGGKALACYVCCLGTMTLVTLVGLLALGLRIDRPDLLVLAMLCTAAAFTGLMMTVSVMGKTEAAVAGSSWGLTMPFAMIGGGMIPLVAMPTWLQEISVISPVRWAIISLEGATWRGFELADMALPCAVLLAFGAGFFTLGVVIFRKTGG